MTSGPPAPPRCFALLGDDEVCLPLLRALIASPQHELIAAAMSGRLLDPWDAELSGLQRTSDWSELVIDPDIEAVIVAGYTPELLRAARQLSAAGKSIVVFPDVRMGGAFINELALDDAEQLRPPLPIFSGRAQPALIDLQRRIAAGELGRVLNLLWERRTRSGGTDTSEGLLSVEQVDRQLLKDIDLLRMLWGDYNEVTALRSGVAGSGLHTATVQLAGVGLPDATWTMRASRDAVDWRVTITGDRHRAVVQPEPGGSDVVLSIDDAVVARYPADGPEQLTHLLGLLDASLARRADAPGWTDAVRAYSLVEATHRSVRRRRTIDVHFEETSERGQFKTQMSAIGCGVLVFTLLGGLLLLLAGAVLDPRDTVQREAEAAGAVFTDEDFNSRTGALTLEGQDRISHLAQTLPRTTSIVIEHASAASAASPESDDANRLRAEFVQQALHKAGRADVDDRIVVRPLKGRWFQTALLLLRTLLFVPLALFLVLQLLLVITHGPVSQGSLSRTPR